MIFKEVKTVIKISIINFDVIKKLMLIIVIETKEIGNIIGQSKLDGLWH